VDKTQSKLVSCDEKDVSFRVSLVLLLLLLLLLILLILTFGFPRVAFVDTRVDNQKPERGTHVDSISYYTHDLATLSKHMYFMQQRKTEIQVTGNVSFEADNWISRVMASAYEVADSIMVDSAEDNALKANYSSFESATGAIPQAEQMTSRYGSFGPIGGTKSPHTSRSSRFLKLNRHESPLLATKDTPVATDSTVSRSDSTESSKSQAPEDLLKVRPRAC
jgi:hypothetical protein